MDIPDSQRGTLETISYQILRITVPLNSPPCCHCYFPIRLVRGGLHGREWNFKKICSPPLPSGPGVLKELMIWFYHCLEVWIVTLYTMLIVCIFYMIHQDYRPIMHNGRGEILRFGLCGVFIDLYLKGL